MCIDQPGCTNFAWRPLKNGTCWLKNGRKTKEEALYDTKGAICGIVEDNEVAIEWNGTNSARNCDFPGSDITLIRDVKNVQKMHININK